LIRFFLNGMEYIADEMEDVLNSYAVPRLFQLDGIPPELWPSFSHGNIERLAARESADIFRLLGGVAGGDVLQRAAERLVEKTDVTDPEELEELMGREMGSKPVNGGRPRKDNLENDAPSRDPAGLDPLRDGGEGE